MPERNGSHVTWRELNLALDPIKSDVAEIKGDVKAMRSETNENAWLGPRARGVVTTIVSGSILAVVSTSLTLAVVHLF